MKARTNTLLMLVDAPPTKETAEQVAEVYCLVIARNALDAILGEDLGKAREWLTQLPVDFLAELGHAADTLGALCAQALEAP